MHLTSKSCADVQGQILACEALRHQLRHRIRYRAAGHFAEMARVVGFGIGTCSRVMSPFLPFPSGWLCRAGTRGSTERRHHGDGDRQGKEDSPPTSLDTCALVLKVTHLQDE